MFKPKIIKNRENYYKHKMLNLLNFVLRFIFNKKIEIILFHALFNMQELLILTKFRRYGSRF